MRLFLRIRYAMARWLWPEGFRGLNSANAPDLPEVAAKWVILDRGHWGTLGATNVGFNRILVTVFKGYSQVSEGILLTPGNLSRLKEMFDEPA